MDENERAYEGIPGGAEMLAWLGRVPSFHDAEIVNLNLFWRAPSTLSLHTWNMTPSVDERDYFVLEKHTVVTFTIEDIIDPQLDGFSHQNVIGGLNLRRAPLDPKRRRLVHGGASSSEDWEIELEPCFGLNGRIRCRKISVSYLTGKPSDFGEWSR
jgi:hypothetical protein